MPDEDKTFSGSFVLDLRIWWRQAHTLLDYSLSISMRGSWRGRSQDAAPVNYHAIEIESE